MVAVGVHRLLVVGKPGVLGRGVGLVEADVVAAERPLGEVDQGGVDAQAVEPTRPGEGEGPHPLLLCGAEPRAFGRPLVGLLGQERVSPPPLQLALGVGEVLLDARGRGARGRRRRRRSPRCRSTRRAAPSPPRARWPARRRSPPSRRWWRGWGSRSWRHCGPPGTGRHRPEAAQRRSGGPGRARSTRSAGRGGTTTADGGRRRGCAGRPPRRMAEAARRPPRGPAARGSRGPGGPCARARRAGRPGPAPRRADPPSIQRVEPLGDPAVDLGRVEASPTRPPAVGG